MTFGDGSWGDGSRDDSGGMDSFGLGFFPVDLALTSGTAAAGGFAGLEVLPFFEADFLMVAVEVRQHLEGIFAVFVGRCRSCEVFWG